MALSPPLLRRVGSLLDQRTRVACCVGSARLGEALADPAVWRRITVHAPGPDALAHVRRVRPEVLHLSGVDVGAAERFVEQLAEDAAARSAVRALRVTVVPGCSLVRSSLLPTLAEFPELRELVLEFGGLAEPGCLAFSADEPLPCLEYLRIVDDGQPRRLEVYFAGVLLPQLREVHLRVATSDVLAHVPRLPRLRVVRYGAERESYEDADLGGANLDALSLDVRDPMAMHFLEVAVGAARRVERLQLTCFCDVEYDADVGGLRHLTIRARPPSTSARVAYWSVRRVGSLTVEAGRVRFVGCGSFNNFMLWTQRTLLFVASEGEVTVDPA